MNTLQSAGRTIESLKDIPVLHMECCHVDTVLGSVSGSAVVGGKWSLQPVRLRFLKVDRTNQYAIIGIYTVETHTQTGCAFFKIGIRPRSGYGNIGKKSAPDTGSSPGSGLRYLYRRLLSDAGQGDQRESGGIYHNPGISPIPITVTLRPGKYYVKETVSPGGLFQGPFREDPEYQGGTENLGEQRGNRYGLEL